MKKAYSSLKDTLEHINKVRRYLKQCRDNLADRGRRHDHSKTKSPEKECFDEVTPLLKDLEYGSEEYRATLRKMKPALTHHYQNNSHHPEYYMTMVCNGCFKEWRRGDEPSSCPQCGYTQYTEEGGIELMSLFDIIEMLMDWKAAGERHSTGDIIKSIEINKDRFKLSEQLCSILVTTCYEMGWLDQKTYEQQQTTKTGGSQS